LRERSAALRRLFSSPPPLRAKRGRSGESVNGRGTSDP
jgi:hypothetical protein